ncbi:MAG TPA: hypothetical protein VHE36_06120 [Sphingomicrobium sp.]|jgi:hypothetical protein|nr:hypothetical protein [Sphingomicrobium sp.]
MQDVDNFWAHRRYPPAAGEGSLDEQVENLVEQGERCRRLARSTYNREVSKILEDMAENYESCARALVKRSS